ncbi:Flagellar biosynthetic protein FliQ [compost metagenome]
MNETVFFELAQRALGLMAMVGAPVLGTSLLVGLAVSIFQAVTQINEATLTFIPKIVVSALVLFLLGPWMVGTILDFMRALLIELPRYAH